MEGSNLLARGESDAPWILRDKRGSGGSIQSSTKGKGSVGEEEIVRSFFRETSGFFPEGTFTEVELPNHFPKQCTTEEAVREVVVTQADILNKREGEKDLARQHARNEKLRKRIERSNDDNKRRWAYEALFRGLDDMPSSERARVIRKVNKLAPGGRYSNMSDDDLKAANTAAKKNWESLSTKATG